MNMRYISTVIILLVMAVSGNAFAAVSATATISPSSTTINRPVSVIVAFRNGTASQLTITNVQLTVASSSGGSTSRIPAAFSVWNQGPNASVTVSGGPNVTTSFNGGQIVFFSPSTGVTGSGTGTFNIGGTVYTSDGSVTAISVGASATVDPIPNPAYY